MKVKCWKFECTWLKGAFIPTRIKNITMFQQYNNMWEYYYILYNINNCSGNTALFRSQQHGDKYLWQSERLLGNGNTWKEFHMFQGTAEVWPMLVPFPWVLHHFTWVLKLSLVLKPLPAGLSCTCTGSKIKGGYLHFHTTVNLLHASPPAPMWPLQPQVCS